MKTTKIRQSANGEECTVRIRFCCNFNTETTALAHLGSGTGKRNNDLNAVYACSDCHDAIDYRSNVFLRNDPRTQMVLKERRREYIEKALGRTHDRLTEKGLM